MSKYNCPVCHREFDIEDSIVEDIITKSKHISSTVSGRHAVHKYLDTHYYIRHCKRCVKIRKLIGYTINFAILVFFLYRGLIDFYHSKELLSLFALPLMLFLIYVFFCLPINFIIYKIFFEPDLDYASSHNALVDPCSMK